MGERSAPGARAVVIEMKEAMSLNQLTAYKKGFERFDLVILDDLGY